MKSPKTLSFPFLAALISLAAVSALIYTPALPSVTTLLSISASQAQFSITVFVLGYALGQLPYGPLSNAIGRKKAIYIGCVIGALGSLLCPLSLYLKSFEFFIVARFIQAIGTSMGLVLANILVTDVHKGKPATRMLSLLMVAFAIAPYVSIALGGFLTQNFSVNSIFYFIAFYISLVGLWATQIDETLAIEKRETPNLKQVVKNLFHVFKNRLVRSSGLIIGFVGAGIVYSFASLAPFLAITHLGITPAEYGLYSLLPPIGQLAGSFVSAKLSTHLDEKQGVLVGLSVAVLFMTIQLILFLTTTFTALILFITTVFIFLGIQICAAQVVAFGLTANVNKAYAASTLQFINMGCGTLVVFTLSCLPQNKITLPLTWIFLMLLGSLIYTRLVYSLWKKKH